MTQERRDNKGLPKLRKLSSVNHVGLRFVLAV